MKEEKESNKKILDHSFTSAQSFMLMFKKAFLCILTISAKQNNNYIVVDTQRGCHTLKKIKNENKNNNYKSVEWVQANSTNEIFYLVAFVQYS